MTSPIVLNKIDHIIASNVQKQTAEGVVHTSDKIRVSKDKQEKKGQSSYKNNKDKLSKINAMLKSMGSEISFVIDNGVLTVVDKDGNVIKTYEEYDLDDLLDKIQNTNGVFIDFKK